MHEERMDRERMDPQTSARELIEIEAIKRLKYRYMRCVDLKLWDELGSLFTPDATCAYAGGRYSQRGREAIVAWLREAMGRDGFHSSHRVHHPEITLCGPDRASGIWALEDTIVDTDHGVQITGSAFYEDRYEKQGDAWRIAHTGYERVFEQIESRADPGRRVLRESRWQPADPVSGED